MARIVVLLYCHDWFSLFGRDEQKIRPLEFNVFRMNVLALHKWLPGLAMLCFAIGAFIPIGFMPGSIVAGTPFVLCPEQNPVLAEMLSSQDGTGWHQHEHKADSASTSGTDTCFFASATFTFMATDIALVAIVSDQPAIVPAGTRAFGQSAPPSPRSARGPPLAATI